MPAQILHFVVDTLCVFFSSALLARFALQAARVSLRNPLGQFIMAVTDKLVLPTRRVVPSWRGYDSASVLLAVAFQVLNLSLATWLAPVDFSISPTLALALLLLALLETLKIWLYLVMGVVLLGAIFSWVNPHAPMAGTVDALARPWLRPFRRLIAPVGGVDLSPLALIVVIQIALMILAGARLGVLPLLVS